MHTRTVLLNLPIQKITGLRPQVWLSIGAGYAREEIKAMILSQGYGFVSEAIGNLQELCTRIAEIPSEKVLSPFARREVLRVFLTEPRILSGMPEIKRIKRQRQFLQRLDQAIQTGRMAFAHPEEEEVYSERLTQSMGKNQLRFEISALAKAFEAWLEASGWYDLPLALRKATQVLRDGWPSSVPQPEEIWNLSVQTPESLEREFWEVLQASVPVTHLRPTPEVPPQQTSSPGETSMKWEKWHTLDDAAEAFADQLEAETQELENHAILIPDQPSVRRSLLRVLEKRGLPLLDPRDPSRLRWDESLKWAISPLEVVARNFERQRVVSWLRSTILSHLQHDEFIPWVQEIHARGIRFGLGNYSGGILSDVHSRLQELQDTLGGKKTCAELGEAHLQYLRSWVGEDSERLWLIPFFESTWNTFAEDLERTGGHHRKAPPLYWLEHLQSRLAEASPPVDRIKPRSGVRIYRLQQAPVERAQKLWIFGLPPQWLEGEGTGSLWFNERERELLSQEFAVRSSFQVRDDRLQILRTWIHSAQQCVFLDAHLNRDGRERESLFTVLKEIELTLGDLAQTFPREPEEKGAHPRLSRSYRLTRPVQPQSLQLAAWTHRNPELTATTLDRISRCSFQALTYHRWNLRDIREPDTELWPDVRGTLLHEAVRILVESFRYDSDKPATGIFTLSAREALEKAWRLKRPRGLIRSTRIEKYVQSRLIPVLENFCEKEKVYREKSRTIPVSLDQDILRLDYPQFSIIGKPDRIDQHAEGLFIIDYKTSGSVPHGIETLERGYRLQLPFYALALRRKSKRPVIGAQFVELDRKAGRKSGVLFQKVKETLLNGKDPGCLTQLRSNSKSLLTIEPDEAWNILEEKIIQMAETFIQGRFEAKPNHPNREQECGNCRAGDLCGARRILDSRPADSNT